MHRLLGLGPHRGAEEVDPLVEVAGPAHLQQPILVFLASRFEPRRDGEHGLLQLSQEHELQHDRQPPDPPVAVMIRVEGLELVVRERGLHDARHDPGPSHPRFPLPESGFEQITLRGRDETRLLDGARVRADQNLVRSDPARILVLRGGALDQDRLQLGQQADAQPPLVYRGEGVLGRPDVVEDLHDLRRLTAGIGVSLSLEDIGEGGVRALERRRAHRFLADGGAPQPGRVRDVPAGLVETAQPAHGFADHQPGLWPQIQLIGQWLRSEGDVPVFPLVARVVALDGDQTPVRAP